jgi:hypothetical protein
VHIDFVAPDVYPYGYKGFHYDCEAYAAGGNPLFIAECATGAGARTERNVFYAIGKFAAIGFDPWSVSRCCPGFMTAPLVSISNGKWSEEAYELQKSYKMIRDVMYPVAMAQNTDNLKVFVQEDGDGGTKLSFGKVDACVRFDHPKNAARGLIVKLSENEYLCAGLGVNIGFSTEGGVKIPILYAEQGKYIGENWSPGYRLARERETWDPVSFLDCRIVKITLDISNVI